MSAIDKGEDAKGIYRSIYVSLWEDRDFQALTPMAKLVLLNLRTSPLSNMPCIYPIYIEAIQKQTGLSETVIKEALIVLCKANWIEYEDGIVWVRKGLKFDPAISIHNDSHVRAIRKVVRSLPRLSIVDSFLAFYGISMEEDESKPTKKTTSKTNIDRLVNLWNVVCGRLLPKVISVTETRIRHIQARFDEHPDFEFWKELFQRIINTPFLVGENDRGWRVDFDFVMTPSGLTKILEGKYESVGKKKQSRGLDAIKEMIQEDGHDSRNISQGTGPDCIDL